MSRPKFYTAFDVALLASDPSNPPTGFLAIYAKTDNKVYGRLPNGTVIELSVEDVVKLTGNQTVGGVKTFSSIPVLPGSDPTTSNQATRKGYVDTKVSLSGNETVAGIKTFSSFPVTPSSAPTTDYQVANKKYVDDNAGGGGGGVTVESSASTSYTLVIADANKYKRMTAATAVTITVPTNASVAFPTGTVVTFVQAGAGQLTVSPVSGTVTLNGGNKSFKQYSVIQLVKVDTNIWDLIGGIE